MVIDDPFNDGLAIIIVGGLVKHSTLWKGAHSKSGSNETYLMTVDGLTCVMCIFIFESAHEAILLPFIFELARP